MKTISLALTDSRMRFATVVFPDPVPPEMPIIMLIVRKQLDRINKISGMNRISCKS
jgi:hypothetical protein